MINERQRALLASRRTVDAMLRRAEIVAHFAARFDRAHALRVLHPTAGQRYSAPARAAAALILESEA